jgi:hypothetical protein
MIFYDKPLFFSGTDVAVLASCTHPRNVKDERRGRARLLASQAHEVAVATACSAGEQRVLAPSRASSYCYCFAKFGKSRPLSAHTSIALGNTSPSSNLRSILVALIFDSFPPIFSQEP